MNKPFDKNLDFNYNNIIIISYLCDKCMETTLDI